MSQTTDTHTQPQHLLSPLGAVALIVGIVIGAGIFKTPAMVAGITGDVGWVVGHSYIIYAPLLAGWPAAASLASPAPFIADVDARFFAALAEGGAACKEAGAGAAWARGE
jgi:acyl-coenzyme A synthetase/AMP-(fatty) acid ligase